MIIIIGQESLEGYGKYILDEFEFESGRVLENVELEYMFTGTPKYDDEGNIINAIVFCHGFLGNYSTINIFHKTAKKRNLFDKKDYFFISITTLGFPDSCSPSSTGLKHKFPQYSIKDRVNFKRKFLKEKLNIENILGVIGYGIGGFETYTWACEYPDEMEFIIVFTSSFKTNGYRYVISKVYEGIIESSDDFYKDGYSESLSKILVSINKIAYSNYFSKRIFQGMSTEEIDVLMDEFVDKGLFMDIYDFKYRNDAALKYNVEDKLKNIKAKALVITQDLYFSPVYDTLPLKYLIKDCKIIIRDSKKHYMDEEDYSSAEEGVRQFLKQFEK